ncbi:LysM peptidoglycan-binding domain-containing protein [Mariniluteicoccus flavus]
MRFARGFAALVFLVGVVGGTPFALFHVGRLPDLSGGLAEALLRPDNGSLLLGLMTLVGWAAWAAFALSVAVEAYAAVRGRRGRVRLPGLGLPQSLASGLVLTVVAMVAAPTVSPAPARAQELTLTQTETTDESARPAAPIRSRPADVTHVVRTGDDLWSIAERHYGDGSQWSRIHAANADLIDNPHQIEAGWRLRIPGAAPTPQSVPQSQPQSEPASARPAHLSIAAGEADAVDPAREADRPVDPAETAAEPTARPVQPEASAPAPAAVASDATLGSLGLLAGGLLSATIAASLSHRRAAQQASRPLGRRFPTPEPAASELAAAAAYAADGAGARALGPALRAIAGAVNGPLPALVAASLGPDHLSLEFDRPLPTPPGFTARGHALELAGPTLHSLLAAPPAPLANPWGAVVTAGVDADGTMALLDLERTPLLSLQGDRETIAGLLNALVVELTSGAWADGVRVTLVGGDGEFAEALDAPSLVHCLDAEAGLRMVEGAYADRPARLTGHERDHRRDPAQVEAWGPQVLVLDAPVNTAEAQRVLALVERGLTVVTTNAVGEVWQVRPGPEASILPDGRSVVAQSVPAPTRDALVAALRATRATHTEPAPWWTGNPRITPLARAADRKESATVDDLHPTVLLLGPTDLVGARGERPSRAVRQCIEYAAWLLEHPGATSPQMAAALFVAEGTRRSNMSRLRTWLGVDDDGQPYLPDAYSGRISLHPAVTSDWDRLRVSVIGGVGRTPEAGLVAALDLVRGAPLADAAPGQWHWAEELRLDIAGCVRDIGVRLAGLALDRGDLDLARWATARALTAAPEDELLLCARVRTEALAGNPSEVRRLAMRLAAHARRLDVELSDETVVLLQEALEGRVRARSVVGA